MSEPFANAHAPVYKDQTIGLTVFGVLQCLLGIVCALFIALLLVGVMLSGSLNAQSPGTASAVSLIPAIAIYGIGAAWFLTMGVGSILGRRWARALTVVSSWIWLVCGIGGMFGVFYILPGFYKQMGADGKIPEGMVGFMTSIAIVTVAIIGVLIPGALLLFYGRQHVKLTCDVKDPVPRWTDACPLPVLAVSFLCSFMGVSMLSMSAYHWTVPFFGTLVSGWSGAAVALVSLAGFLFAARGTYKLDMKAWWVTFALVVLWCLSAFITTMRVDITDYYRAMQMPQEQIDQMKNFLPATWKRMGAFYAVWYVAFACYLVYVRKYFTAARPV